MNTHDFHIPMDARIIKLANERRAATDRAVVKELLGSWVSELEPVTVLIATPTRFNDDGAVVSTSVERIVGLAAKGHNTIAVRRRS